MFLLLVLLVLGLAIALFVLIGGTNRQVRDLGLTRGTIVAADDARLTLPTLRSDRLGLVGRPDHLLRDGGTVIPVEQKPNARVAQPSHVMQVAAQCALVQEVYGVRPPYGLLVLAGGIQYPIPFTSDVEQSPHGTMEVVREFPRGHAKT